MSSVLLDETQIRNLLHSVHLLDETSAENILLNGVPVGVVRAVDEATHIPNLERPVVLELHMKYGREIDSIFVQYIHKDKEIKLRCVNDGHRNLTANDESIKLMGDSMHSAFKIFSRCVRACEADVTHKVVIY